MRSVVAWCAGDLAAGVSSGSAQVEVVHRRPVSGHERAWPVGEHLRRGYVQVADVAVGQSDTLLKLLRSEQLPFADGLPGIRARTRRSCLSGPLRPARDSCPTTRRMV